MGQSESKKITQNFTLLECITQNRFLELHKAQSKLDGSDVSVFVQKMDRMTDPDMIDLIGHAVKKLKVLRHPGIIKFLDAQLDSTDIFIVTEPVLPLFKVLSSLQADDICIGMFYLLKTIDFLHSKKLCHNALQLDSIYVSEIDGRWLLGGLEFLKSFHEIDANFIQKLPTFLPESIIPPEDKDPTLGVNECIQSRDYFALGQLLGELISPFLMPDYINEPMYSVNWKDLQASIDHMSSRNPKARYSPKVLLESPFFKNNVLIDIVENFKELRSISIDIKKRFLAQIPTKMKCLSPMTINTKILPLILKIEHFAEPGIEILFGELFGCCYETKKPNKGLTIIREDSQVMLLTKEAYQEKILPFIKKALLIRQYEVRMICLKLLPRFVHQLIEWDPPFVSTLIQEFLLGLDEIQDDIYTLSLCSIMCLIPLWIQANSRQKSKPTKGTSLLQSRASLSSLLQYTHLSPKKEEKNHSVDSTIESKATFPTIILKTKQQTEIVAQPITLIENVILPHTIKACVSDDFSIEFQWMILDELISLWKQISILRDKTIQKQDSIQMTRSLLKCIHLIMRTFDATNKIEFFCHHLMGSIDFTKEALNVLWIPKIIELGIFFLRDESKQVRQEIGQSLISIISLTSQVMDKTPNVSKKRENDSLRTKLNASYCSLSRSGHLFHRMGPRALQHYQDTRHEQKRPTIAHHTITSTDSQWEEDWDVEFKDDELQEEILDQEMSMNEFKMQVNSEHLSVQPATLKSSSTPIEIQIEEQFIPSKEGTTEKILYKENEASNKTRSLKPKQMTKSISRQHSTSDIADIGMGAWDQSLQLDDVPIE